MTNLKQTVDSHGCFPNFGPSQIVHNMESSAHFWPTHAYLLAYVGVTVILAAVHTGLAYLAVTVSGRCRAVMPHHKMMYVTADLTKAVVLLLSMAAPYLRIWLHRRAATVQGREARPH